MNILVSFIAMLIGFAIAIGSGMAAVKLMKTSQQTRSIWLELLALIAVLGLLLIALAAFLAGSCFGLTVFFGG